MTSTLTISDSRARAAERVKELCPDGTPATVAEREGIIYDLMVRQEWNLDTGPSFIEAFSKEWGLAESTIRNYSANMRNAMARIVDPVAMKQVLMDHADAGMRGARSDGEYSALAKLIDTSAKLLGLIQSGSSVQVNVFGQDGALRPDAPEQIRKALEARDRTNVSGLLSLVADRLSALDELTHETVRLEIEALRSELTGEVE